MFNPRKSDQFPGSPGTVGIILAALLGLYFVVTLFSSGTAPLVILGCLALFGVWWVYTRFFSKAKENEFAKYQKAVKRQKKKSPPTQEKGKVIYLENHRNK